MSNKNLTIGLIVVGIIAIIALVTPVAKPAVVSTPSFGGVTNYDELTLQDTGTTTLKVLGGTTTQGGCIEMNATSSATKVNLRIFPSATSTYNGVVAWNYGVCE